MSWKKYILERHPEIIEGNYLKKNEAVRNLSFNQTASFPLKVTVTWLITLGVLIAGLVLAWRI